MQRNVIFVLALLVLLLAAALAFVLLRGQPGAVPISTNTPDENVVEPYHQEMDCIDRLIQSHNLSANEVEPALASCQSGRPGNQSEGQ
ncbi:MAG: hypothetical protein QOC98_3399 [Frankiaceae bacterium]|nr:hypothetical protein [Frankiaceae bacterium]